MTLHRINPILYQIMTHKIHYSDFNLKRILAHNANAKMDEMRLFRDTWAPFAESHPEEMEADTDRNIAPGLASERGERWRRPIRVKLSHTGKGTPCPCFNGKTGLLINSQAGRRAGPGLQPPTPALAPSNSHRVGVIFSPERLDWLDHSDHQLDKIRLERVTALYIH